MTRSKVYIEKKSSGLEPYGPECLEVADKIVKLVDKEFANKKLVNCYQPFILALSRLVGEELSLAHYPNDVERKGHFNKVMSDIFENLKEQSKMEIMLSKIKNTRRVNI